MISVYLLQTYIDQGNTPHAFDISELIGILVALLFLFFPLLKKWADKRKPQETEEEDLVIQPYAYRYEEDEDDLIDEEELEIEEKQELSEILEAGKSLDQKVSSDLGMKIREAPLKSQEKSGVGSVSHLMKRQAFGKEAILVQEILMPPKGLR